MVIKNLLTMKTFTTEAIRKFILINLLLFFGLLIHVNSYGSNWIDVKTTLVSDTTDNDQDGVFDDIDIDDDNDGILDIDEGSIIPSSDFKIVVEIDLDSYEEETSWDLQDSDGNVLIFGDSYGNNDDVIIDSISVSDEGGYVLNVYDSYGDGLGYSGGSNTNGTSGYSVSVNGILYYASGNLEDFGYSTSTDITIGSSTNYNASVYSQSGVSSSSKILGAPDGRFGKWHSNGDEMVVDFGTVYPAGTEYEITWKLKSGSSTAIMYLEESDNNYNYTIHSSLPTTSSTSTTTTTVVSESDVRYIYIAQFSSYSSVDFQIDAIGVNINTANNNTPVFIDTDNDGIVNSYDLDSDNDGISDLVEAGGIDNDTNGVVDGIFLDTDGDGWSDVFDTDDGGTELDDDDYDADGFENRVDIDSDDDGLVDIIEAQVSGSIATISNSDSDNDGIDDAFDKSNGNSFLSPVNTEGEDNPDYLDNNSDNDLYSDLIEAYDTDHDFISNIYPSGADADADGLDDNFDLVIGTGTVNNVNNNQSSSDFPNQHDSTSIEVDFRETYDIPNDNDNDGITDALDFDDDGDGLDDYIECFSEQVSVSGMDGGSTNYFSYSDPIMARFDFDYIDNDMEIKVNNVSLFSDFIQFQSGSIGGDLILFDSDDALIVSPWLSNTNNLPRFRILIDQDGSAQMFATRNPSSTELEPVHLTSNSSVEEYTLTSGTNTFTLINSDGPGLDGFSVNVYLSTLASCDQDGDLVPNYLDIDSDNDGITDLVEAGGSDQDGNGREDEGANGESGVALIDDDFDGDGIPNRLDIDSDNDGIIDLIESQTTNDFIDPTDLDTDIDGWDNSFDSDNGGTAISLSDNDGVELYDYIDIDSDGDASPDWLEAFDDDGNGDALNDLILRADNFESDAANPNFYVNTDDADADGIPNWLEDDDADNSPNFLDPDNILYQDTDQDGLADLFDADTYGVGSSLPDSDNAGDKDYRDGSQGVSLPIVLKSFDARLETDRVRLGWVTSAEINNDFFLIERSINGGEFEIIATVDGAGNSNHEITYYTYDENPQIGDNYYRLRQVDFDGKNTESNIKAIKFASNSEENKVIEGSIYPNPGNGETLFLKLDKPAVGDYSVEILTVRGSLLDKSVFSVNGEIDLNVELLKGKHYGNGTYLINVSNGISIKTFKYVVNQL
jgi:hypothetical protein